MPPSIMSEKQPAQEEGGIEALRAKLWAAPYDPRFPNQNQTRNCYTNYLDYHRCRKVKGEDYGPCEYFKKVYMDLCPSDWYEKWDEQREQNIFPGKI